MEDLPIRPAAASRVKALLSVLFFDEQNRPRLLWRIFIFSSLFIALTLFFGGIALSISGITQQSDIRTIIFVNGLASLAAALTAGWITGRVCEHLTLSDLGIKFDRMARRFFAFGLFYGFLVFCFAAGIAMLFPSLDFVLNPEIDWQSFVVSMLAAGFFLSAPAAFEEALFRGYILQTFVRARMAFFGVIVTSALFAGVHQMNPNLSNIAIFNTFLAGIWFATAYLISNNLWFPIAIHFAWNWTQVAIFGMELSGFEKFVETPLLKEIDRGPEWISGGNYGIEGSIACTAAIVLAVSANVYVLVRKKRLQNNSTKPSES